MKRIMLGAVLSIVALLAVAGPAAAGGWAVSTLDSVPVAEPGATVEVGFTIRQHGVTPINPDGAVGIVLRSATGAEEFFFAAEPVGAVGHYVAEVTFPDDGTWSWAVRQGWFADQELGDLELAPVSAPSAATAAHRGPAWLRYGLPVLAIVLAAGAGRELVRNGQRPRRVPAT